MNRNQTAILLASCITATLAACGNTNPADGTLEVTVTVVGIEGGIGVVLVDNGSAHTCSTQCNYVADINGAGILLTPDAGATSEFVGWSGDCTGTEPVSFEADGDPVSCTATFRGVTGADGTPREGGMVATRRTCYSTGGDTFSCTGPAGGSLNLNAPTPALDDQLISFGDNCYFYFDVEAFPTEDWGDVDFTSSQAGMTAVWTADRYNFLNPPASGNPLGTTDTLTVTTETGEVSFAVPADDMVMNDGATGLFITTATAPEWIRWMAFGVGPNNEQGGVLCRFPGAASFEVTPDEGIAALAEAGIDPLQLFIGAANSEIIPGFDDEDRLVDGARLFGIDWALIELAEGTP